VCSSDLAKVKPEKLADAVSLIERLAEKIDAEWDKRP
jgi:hypothetical protein